MKRFLKMLWEKIKNYDAFKDETQEEYDARQW